MDYKIVFNLVKDGKLSILKYMLEKTLDNKSAIDNYVQNAILDGQTLLIVASKNNHIDIVNYLIRCNVDLEQTGTVNFDGEAIEEASPLWIASACGNLEIVKCLVENGANVNSTTKTRSSPLRAACYDGHLNIVKYLVEHGADIELTNRHGHTCLMIASFKNNYEIVNYLLDQGAKVNKRSVKGNTALHDAAEANATEIMKLLIEKGKGIMMEDTYKITPILTASLNGNESIVHLLVNYGVDPLTGKLDESKSLCTEIEKIHALELLGSTYIDKKRDMCTGIHYWRLGFERRLENIKRILNNLNVKDGETIDIYKKKIAKPNRHYNYSKEFNSLEELEQIIANVDEVRMQSLIIRERILGQTHVDTTYYIRFRGAVYADSGDFERCYNLWLYALDKQQNSLDPLSPLSFSSLFSFAELFSYMMSNKAELVSFEKIFSVFKRALFELESAILIKSAILILPNKKIGQNNKLKYNKMKLLQRITGRNQTFNELRIDDCLEDDLIRGVVEDNELNDFILNNNLNNDQLLKNIIGDLDENGDQLTTNKIINNNLEDLKDDIESINFHRILVILQLFIGLLCRLKPVMTNDQLYRLKKTVYQLVKLNPKGNNGFSFLHQACSRDESCQLIKFPICEMPITEIAIIQLLIDVGADVNALDNDNNTPLLIVAKNRPNAAIIKVLIDNGAHLDIKNKFNECPLDFLIDNSTVLNDYHIYPLQHLSLQCLCAQTINKNNLEYKGFLSKKVTEFVKIH